MSRHQRARSWIALLLIAMPAVARTQGSPPAKSATSTPPKIPNPNPPSPATGSNVPRNANTGLPMSAGAEANADDPNARKDPCHPCAVAKAKGGVGVCREKTPESCTDCKARGEWLEGIYEKVLRDYAVDSAIVATLGRSDPKGDAAFADQQKKRDEIHYLRAEWSILRAHCPALPPLGSGGGPAARSTGGGSGTPGGGGGGGASGASGGGAGAGAAAPTGPIGGRAAVYGVIRATPSATPRGTGRPPTTLIRGAATLVARDFGTQRRLSQSWHKITLQSSRSDFDALAVPAPNLFAIPADASPGVRAGLECVIAREREIADLEVYALSLARYRGAQQRHDGSAMTMQADAMLRSIGDAATSAHDAAAKQVDAERLLASELASVQRQVKSSAGGWEEAVRSAAWTSERDIPPAISHELTADGVARVDIASMLAATRQIRATDADAAISELLATAAKSEAERAASARGGGALNVIPPDDEALKRAEKAAREMRMRAEQR